VCVAVTLALAPAAPGLRAQTPPLPDLGDPVQASMSPAQERKIGETIIRQLRAAGGYMNDPEVNDYLMELGGRLVAASKDAKTDFEFFAVPDSQINAFALPGGYIGVNTGLILLTQNESELASVLAHEITHVTQHHVARMIEQQQTSVLTSLAALAVAILASRAGGSQGQQVGSAAVASAQALQIQNQLNFTRENEYEADRIGFQRLAAANFDVTAMGTFMTRLQSASRFSESGAPSYLRTHPITYERVAEAQARAQGYSYRQVTDSLDFHMVRALLRSYQGEARQAVAFFDEALAERKYNSEVAAQYGLVASLLRAEDMARAKTALARLEKIAPPHPMVEAMAGHVLQESGDIAGAVKRFEGALTRYPNKMQLVYDYPEALLKAGRAAEASAFAEAQLLRFTGDGPLHLIAAKAYAAQNKQLKEHQHQGEYYVWQGDLRGAVTQFEMAMRANDSNFYDASVVETRLRSLRKDLAEQQKEVFGRNG
jgi:predicted Zn-dependent protease